jgi:hypothetical protein
LVVVLLNQILRFFKIGFISWQNVLTGKNDISESCGYPNDDLKLFFGEHEMNESEIWEDLAPLGFIKRFKITC